MRIIGGLLLDNEQRATMEEFYNLVETTQLLDGMCVMTDAELGEFIDIVEYRVQHDDLYHPVSEYIDLMKDVLAGRQSRSRG